MPDPYVREELPLNMWDSFQPQGLPIEEPARPWLLFAEGGVAKKNVLLSNQHVEHVLVGADQHAVVLNWYARSNIEGPDLSGERLQVEFERAWASWTHLTVVTFILGASPICHTTLYDLLRRGEGQKMPGKGGLAVVPPRQICHVAIQDSRRARRRLVEATLSHTLGDPFRVVWVHLEGVAQRWSQL